MRECKTHKLPIFVSTGIHDCLTFGHGELDDLGFWEIPCHEAAREYEHKHPNEKAWPHVHGIFTDTTEVTNK